MPAVERKVWTSEDVRRLRDEQEEQRPFETKVRYEVVDGELLVTPAPVLLHQVAVQRLDRLLDDYVTARRIGWSLGLAADVELDARSNVQPDIFVAPLSNGKRPVRWSDLGALMLVIEILSPSTARYDRGPKRQRYQRAGIPEYWIIDLDARIVERWRPVDERPEIVSESLTWHPSGASEPLIIDVARYFADVWQDDVPSVE